MGVVYSANGPWKVIRKCYVSSIAREAAYPRKPVSGSMAVVALEKYRPS